TAGAVTLKGTSGTVAAGALLTFTVTHAAADHIDLTGSTADLASGTTRLEIGRASCREGKEVAAVADATLVIHFANDSGAGNRSRPANEVTASRDATHVLSRTTAGAVTLKGTSGTVAAGALLTFTVTHAAADHIDLTGSTADLASGTTRL